MKDVKTNSYQKGLNLLLAADIYGLANSIAALYCTKYRRSFSCGLLFSIDTAFNYVKSYNDYLSAGSLEEVISKRNNKDNPVPVHPSVQAHGDSLRYVMGKKDFSGVVGCFLAALDIYRQYPRVSDLPDEFYDLINKTQEEFHLAIADLRHCPPMGEHDLENRFINHKLIGLVAAVCQALSSLYKDALSEFTEKTRTNLSDDSLSPYIPKGFTDWTVYNALGDMLNPDDGCGHNHIYSVDEIKSLKKSRGAPTCGRKHPQQVSFNNLINQLKSLSELLIEKLKFYGYEAKCELTKSEKLCAKTVRTLLEEIAGQDEALISEADLEMLKETGFC